MDRIAGTMDRSWRTQKKKRCGWRSWQSSVAKVFSTGLSCDHCREITFSHQAWGKKGRTPQLDFILGTKGLPRGVIHSQRDKHMQYRGSSPVYETNRDEEGQVQNTSSVEDRASGDL